MYTWTLHTHVLPGDPTVFGNFPPHPAVGKALQDVMDQGGPDALGYHHSSGWKPARQAVVDHISRYSDNSRLTYEVSFLVSCWSQISYSRSLPVTYVDYKITYHKESWTKALVITKIIADDALFRMFF